jgi:putative transposase
MSKDRRLEIVNGIYHVMARGNRKDNVFEDGKDRHRFIKILSKAVDQYGIQLFSEARMGNHYHLVVKTPNANLSCFMRDLNRDFSKYSNRRHGRIGHLFNEPYQPILVDNAFYLRVAIGYVLMNPVSHGFVRTPEAWRWSSYRATVGLEATPEYLCLDWLDTAFPAASRALSTARFVEYLTSRTWSEGEGLLAKPLVGSTDFEREMREHIAATLFMAALPASYRAAGRPPLPELFPEGMSKAERNHQMLRAHVVYAYPMSEIARALCLHPGSVSRIIARLRKNSRAA